MSIRFDERFYEYLNVASSATQDEIKEAWRKRARESHTDAVGNDSRNEDFNNAALAYEVLRNPRLRAEYDEWLAQRRAIQDSSYEDDPEPEFSPPSPPRPPSPPPPPPMAATQPPGTSSPYMPQPVDSGSSSYIVWSLLAASAVITGIVYWVLPSTPSANLPYTRIQQQHQQNIVDLAFSPDGKKVASASEDGTVLVSEPNGTDQTKIESPGTDEDGLQAIPSAVAFSTDGKFLAIGYTNGFVEIFDPNNLTSEGESNISLPSVRVAGLAFGTNGQDDILAIASVGRKSSGSLSLYDLSDSGKAKIIINQPVSRVAFSFDGKLIADAYGGLVEVRNSADGTLIFSASGDTALSLAFNPDSDVLAIAEPSRVQLWYAGENEIIKSIPHRQLSQGNLFVNGQFVAYSPDGTYLAYVNEPSSSNGGYASEIEICSAADYSQISSRLDDPYIYAMAFSSRGLLATGGGPGNGAPGFGDNSAHIWSLHDLRPS